MDTLELELLIFKVFGQDKNFDKINNQFLRANQIMFDEHQFSLDFGFTEPEILILKGKNLLK